MKLSVALHRRLHWLNFPVISLIALLQRTPLLRFAATAEEMVTASPVGVVLKSAAALAALGAVHSLAGATTLVVDPTTVSGTVGTPITPVSFFLTGAPVVAGSYAFSGNFPPGLNVVGVSSPTILNIEKGQIEGTPTAAGTFNVTIQAWESPGASGAGSNTITVKYTITGGAVTTAPNFTTQPQSLTVAAGGSATFTVAVDGSPTPTLQWRKDGQNIAGQTNATLTLNNVTSANAGSYTVVATNSVGATTSNTATLTLVANTSTPTISLQPLGQIVSAGANVGFTVAVTGTPAPTLQWQKNGVVINGATFTSLQLTNVQLSDAGSYSVTATNSAGFATSNSVPLAVSSPTPGTDARLYAISCRAFVGTGDNVLIPGIIVVGSGPRNVIVRAKGPSIAGVSGTLAQPQLQLFQVGVSGAIASNIGWSSGTAANTAALQAAFTQAGLPQLPLGSADCALLATLDAGKAYTAQISGVGGTTGVGLVEVYEAGTGSAKMFAISCRAQVGSGGDILIPGIIILGSSPKQVIIRAASPAGVAGALATPQLALFNSAGVKIAENIGWSTAANAPEVFNTTPRCGLVNFSPGAADCAILVTLPPGGYTAQVSGAGNTTGVAIIEVYEVP